MSDAIAHVAGESSPAFLAEGYLFGTRRFERSGADVFTCRLLGRPAIMMRGRAAARFFYEEQRMSRVGAMPRSVAHSLQDEGSVQTLSGDPHRARKALFLDAFGHEGRLALTAAFERNWQRAEQEWSTRPQIDLGDEVAEVLTRAALEWIGTPLDDAATRDRRREFQAMIDGAGSFGPRNWRGRMLRRRTEAWARRVVAERREQRGGAQPAPVDLIAQWRDPDGEIDERVAAVELLNALRPVVAVAQFIVFAALALRRHPEWGDRVVRESAARAAFAAEVRRTAPFFPVIAGRPTEELTWNGIRMPRGRRVVLDLFATNRHPREWADAGRFDPSRFLTGGEDPRGIVAQGAGDMVDGHRCPGEPATQTLLEVALTALARAEWSPVDGIVGVDLRRIPARPGPRPLRVRWRG